MRSAVLALVMLLGSAAVGQNSSQSPHDASSNDPAKEARAREDACVSDLRLLGTAQATYSGMHPERGFARTLGELGPKGENLVGPTLPKGSEHAEPKARIEVWMNGERVRVLTASLIGPR